MEDTALGWAKALATVFVLGTLICFSAMKMFEKSETEKSLDKYRAEHCKIVSIVDGHVTEVCQ
jgi:hypothetical protein